MPDPQSNILSELEASAVLRATSPRVVRPRESTDFRALDHAVIASTIRHGERPTPPPEMHWFLYGDALERALLMRDYGPLLRALERGLPAHPKYLPLIADAMRAMLQGKRAGKPRALTSLEREAVIQGIRRRKRKDRLSIEAAQAEYAAMLGVSLDTIRRVWRQRARCMGM